MKGRNAVAIPGVILVFYSVAALVYVLAYRRPGPACADATTFLVGGACYHAVPFLAAALILGASLIGLAATRLRRNPAAPVDELQPGTPTYALVSLVASLTVVLALTAAVLGYIQRREHFLFETPLGAGRIYTVFLLLVAAGLALLALIPVLALLGAQGRRRRRYLQALSGETPSYGEPESHDAPQPADFVDDERWPAAREGETAEIAGNR